MRVFVAFFAGENDRWDRIVRWWTGSKFTHTELVMPDAVSWIGISPFTGTGISLKKRNSITPETHMSGKWKYLAFDCTSAQVERLRDFFARTRGCSYDWFGMIASQLTPWRIKTPGKWYCSEWVAHALTFAGIIDSDKFSAIDRKDLSPGTIWDMLRSEASEVLDSLLNIKSNKEPLNV